MPRTRIAEDQIRLRDIFSVERILAARGFTVESTEQIQTTLLRKENATEVEINEFFERFDSTEKRNQCLKSLQSGSDYNEMRKRYSSTLEWYIGELLVRKFQAFSSSFGVKARNTIRPSTDTMGDFDVLSVMGDASLFYAECKSGEINFSDVQKAVERGLVLATAATVIVYERGLDIKQLLNGKNYPGLDIPCETKTVAVAKLQNSEVKMWHDAFFIDARKGLENKLQTCLRLVAQRKNGYLQVFGADIDYLNNRGFEVGE